MGNKSAEKIIDGLSQLLEGFSELQESIHREYKKGKATEIEEDDDDEETEEDEVIELDEEAEAAVAQEVRAALEAVLESEDHSVEEVASLMAAISEGLEEIDPDIFAAHELEGEEEEDDDDYTYDDDDDDYGYEDDEDEAGEDDDDEEGLGKSKKSVAKDEDEDDEPALPKMAKKRK